METTLKSRQLPQSRNKSRINRRWRRPKVSCPQTRKIAKGANAPLEALQNFRNSSKWILRKMNRSVDRKPQKWIITQMTWCPKRLLCMKSLVSALTSLTATQAELKKPQIDMEITVIRCLPNKSVTLICLAKTLAISEIKLSLMQVQNRLLVN